MQFRRINVGVREPCCQKLRPFFVTAPNINFFSVIVECLNVDETDLRNWMMGICLDKGDNQHFCISRSEDLLYYPDTSRLQGKPRSHIFRQICPMNHQRIWLPNQILYFLKKITPAISQDETRPK